MRILVTIPSNIEAEILTPLLPPKLSEHLLISGVGIPHTTFSVTRALLEKPYDLALQLGIAGSFAPQRKKGEVVVCREDCFADIGFIENKKFISLATKGLGKHNSLGMTYGGALPDDTLYGRGITINTVNRSPGHLDQLRSNFQADMVSMEGAAFYMVCREIHVPALQIRGISNGVEETDKSAWQIELALEHIIHYLKKIDNVWN